MNLRDERAVTKTIGCDGIDFIVLCRRLTWFLREKNEVAHAPYTTNATCKILHVD